MNRTRPYLNRFVKIKEQEIVDVYHTANLKEIKPITSKLMEHSETIVINHSKREMIKEVRESEIQRENRLLLNKISSVMSKKGNYSVTKTKSYHAKPNKSLNQFYRKKQLQNIEYENKKFLHRLQGKKPTVNLQKINKDWIDNKDAIKRLSNQEFYLSNLRSNSSRIKQNSFNQKIIKDNIKFAKINKMKTIDGHKMMIRIQFIDNLLKIVGDSQDHKDLKVIQIPKEEAIIFIQKDCNGKLQLILEKLRYDANSQTLYLISENIQDDEIYFKQFNPEINSTKKTNKNTMKDIRMNKSAVEDSHAPQMIQKEIGMPIQTISHPDEPANNSIQCEKQRKLEHCKHCPPKGSEKRNKHQAKQKTQSVKQVQRERTKKTIEQVQKEENVQPQEAKYEEENFEEPIKQISAKEQIQEIADSTKLSNNPKQNAEKIQKQIIVQPEDNDNYVQEFQESKESKREIEHPQQMHNKQKF